VEIIIRPNITTGWPGVGAVMCIGDSKKCEAANQAMTDVIFAENFVIVVEAHDVGN
jgi:hypothetical protein